MAEVLQIYIRDEDNNLKAYTSRYGYGDQTFGAVRWFIPELADTISKKDGSSYQVHQYEETKQHNIGWNIRHSEPDEEPFYEEYMYRIGKIGFAGSDGNDVGFIFIDRINRKIGFITGIEQCLRPDDLDFTDGKTTGEYLDNYKPFDCCCQSYNHYLYRLNVHYDYDADRWISDIGYKFMNRNDIGKMITDLNENQNEYCLLSYYSKEFQKQNRLALTKKIQKEIRKIH